MNETKNALKSLFIYLFELRHLNALGVNGLDTGENKFADLVNKLEISLEKNEENTILVWKSDSILKFLGCPVKRDGIYFSETGLCNSSKKFYEPNISSLEKTHPEILHSIKDQILGIQSMFLDIDKNIREYFK